MDALRRRLRGGETQQKSDTRWRRVVSWGKALVVKPSRHPSHDQQSETSERDLDEPNGASEPTYRPVYGSRNAQLADELGVHAATRYHHIRGVIEGLDGDEIDHALFGLLLSAESMRDEMRAYDEQKSWLLRLAQTGHQVGLIERLHGVLDAMSAQYTLNELPSLNEWEAALEQERRTRVKRYHDMLGSLAGSGGDDTLLDEIESEEQQEEVLTLLKAAISKYGTDVLTSEETEITVKAFQVVAQYSNLIIMSLPSWLVMPFEFSSTFGLSRWGNDAFYPDYSDATHFVQDANAWSSLNHPHVAKFLGACHVGSRPFIVHERVRSLSQYMSEAKDRQQVWGRLYEVALALQYLHERDLSCGDRLTMANVFCAEFEAKAMVFGVDLVVLDECNGDDFAERSTEDAKVVGVLILNCLRELSLLAGGNDALTPQHEERNSAREYRSLPTSRPNYVDEAEWASISKIWQLDTVSPAPMLHVIELLRDLTGLDVLRDPFDDLQFCDRNFGSADGAIQIGAVVVPALRMSIRDTLSDCATMAESDDLSVHIQQRFDDIFTQLEVMLLKEADGSLAKELVIQFANLLVRHYRSLEQKVGVSDSSFGAWSEKKPVSLFSLHMDIDRFMASHSLSRSNSAHSWEPKWALLCSKDQWGQLSALIRQRPVQGSTLNAESPLHSSLLSDALDSTDASTSQTKLPNWFLPPSEVQFKSFAEFSRGAFGSVHHGKWFDTLVVVKNVFTDVAAREKIQSQFFQEADTWFQLNHINVVKMYGACHISQPFFVCEYASGGDLTSYLRRKGRQPYLIWYSLLNAALGLQYLHGKGIVHADLKANNILVGADEIAKLADFGLSVSIRDEGATEGGGALGAYRWKAPECIAWNGVPGKAATLASDVYSFAMVMIEVLTGTYPWGTLPDVAVIAQAKKGVLPIQPPEISASEWHLIQRMCYLDPANRVTIDAVVVHLSSLLERLDIDRLRSVTQAGSIAGVHKNRVASREGAMLCLVELAKSKNKQLASFASAHLVAVHINRGARSETQEVEALVELLRNGSQVEKARAVQALRALSDNDANKELIVSCGGIPLLVALLVNGADDFKENAAASLKNLTWKNADSKVQIAKCGGISPLVALLSSGNDAQKEHAAGALMNLSVDPDNVVAIASCGGIPALIDLVSNGNSEQRKMAAATVWGLSVQADNMVEIARCGGIPPLVALIRHGNDIEKANAAGALWYLSLNDENKVLIASCDGIPPLVALVSDGGDHQKTNAVSALWNLSLNDNNKALIARCGGISPLVSLMINGNDVQREKAMTALWSLTVNNENKVLIAASGCIPALLSLVSVGSDSQREKAAGALLNLSLNDENKSLIASCGGIPPLVALASDGNDVQKENAAGILWNLSFRGDNKVLIVVCGGIPPLVAMICEGNAQQKEKAVATLWNLSETDEGKAMIASCEGIPPLVALMSDTNDVIKEKAAATISHLAVREDNKLLIALSGGIPPLVALLTSGNEHHQEKAVSALWSLSVNNANKVLIGSCGAIPPLMQLVSDGSNTLKEKVLAVLRNLSVSDKNKLLIASCEGVSPLVALTISGNDVQKERAAGILANLSLNDANQVLIASCGGIPPLVTLVASGNDSQKENAADALWNLSANDENKAVIASCDGIPLLVAMMSDGDDFQKATAAGILGNVSSSIDNAMAIATCGGIPPLIALVRDGNNNQKENAAIALMNLSVNEDSKRMITSSGGIPPLVALICDGDDVHKECASGVLWNLAYQDATAAAEIAAHGGVDELLVLIADGTDEQKLWAAGALGFMGPSAQTKALVAAHGGIAAVLQYVRDSDDDDETMEGLVALRNLCRGCDRAVATSLTEAGGIAILSDLAHSDKEKHGTLARAILSDVMSDSSHQRGP